MKRILGASLAILVICGTAPARADDKDATEILDKAIKALGGEENLTKAMKAKWTSKGTVTFNGNENELKTTAMIDGLDKHRSEAEGEFNGNDFHMMTILNGDKGWREFGDNVMDLDDDAIANEKRVGYLQFVPMFVLPLKTKDFKAETDGEEKVDGKPTAKVKATGPDGKTFTLFFDKESGLPVRMTATVKGFMGEDYVQDNSFASYKDFDGIKKATKIESKRDGEPLLKMDVTEFKVLSKFEPGTFDEP